MSSFFSSHNWDHQCYENYFHLFLLTKYAHQSQPSNLDFLCSFVCTRRGCRVPARCGRRSRCAPATPPRAAPSPPSARPLSPAAAAGPWPWLEELLPSRDAAAAAATAAAAAAAQMDSATLSTVESRERLLNAHHRSAGLWGGT